MVDLQVTVSQSRCCSAILLLLFLLFLLLLRVNVFVLLLLHFDFVVLFSAFVRSLRHRRRRGRRFQMRERIFSFLLCLCVDGWNICTTDDFSIEHWENMVGLVYWRIVSVSVSGVFAWIFGAAVHPVIMLMLMLWRNNFLFCFLLKRRAKKDMRNKWWRLETNERNLYTICFAAEYTEEKWSGCHCRRHRCRR